MSTSVSDDDTSLPDPRYQEWDRKARVELRVRLYDGTHKRLEKTDELIAQTVDDELSLLGVVDEDSLPLSYRRYSVSQEVETKTRKCIDAQIRSWKGLRWRRFNGKGCSSWSQWLKKAKCWQDQNSFAPMGVFWCLILDELQTFTRMLSQQICATMAVEEQHMSHARRALYQCLFVKCIESILAGNVRFARTRQTPLLPVRTLSKSEDLQSKLARIDGGFKLSSWKAQNATPTDERSKTAALLSVKCVQHCRHLHQSAIATLRELMPDLDIPERENEDANGMSFVASSDDAYWHTGSESNANTAAPSMMNSVAHDEMTHVGTPTIRSGSNQYGPTRGINPMLRSQLYRHSPLSAAPNAHPEFGTPNSSNRSNNSISTFPSPLTVDNVSPHEHRLRFHRLKLENSRLRMQLADVEHRLQLQSPALVDADQISVLRAMIRQMERQNQVQHYLLMQHMVQREPIAGDVLTPSYGAPVPHSQLMPSWLQPPPIPSSLMSSPGLLNDGYDAPVQPMYDGFYGSVVNGVNVPPTLPHLGDIDAGAGVMLATDAGSPFEFAPVQPHSADDFSVYDQQPQNPFHDHYHEAASVAPMSTPLAGAWESFAPHVPFLPSVFDGNEPLLAAPAPTYAASGFGQYPR